MGLLIFPYVIRHDKSFVLLISIPLESKSQGTQQRAGELISFPGYWLCRGSSLNQWHEHPPKSTDMVCLTQAVRKCPKRAGVVLAPPSGQIREKKLFFCDWMRRCPEQGQVPPWSPKQYLIITHVLIDRYLGNLSYTLSANQAFLSHCTGTQRLEIHSRKH